MKRWFLIFSAIFAWVGACGSNDSCPAEQTRCGSACRYLPSDLDNCGACGHACGVSQGCSVGMCFTYTSGACSRSNPVGECFGGNVCLGGACVPPSSVCSPANRGGACPSAQECINGVCMPSAVCTLGQTFDCTCSNGRLGERQCVATPIGPALTACLGCST